MPSILIHVEHEIGSTVYLKTDPDQLQRIVTVYLVDMSNTILYKLMVGDEGSYHYSVEISTEKSFTNAGN